MTVTTDRMSTARHPRQPPKPDIVAAIVADRSAARDGDLDDAWRLSERTHISSQAWSWPHVRSHLDMLHPAIHTRGRREIVGQTERRPMPLPEDLAELLAASWARR